MILHASARDRSNAASCGDAEAHRSRCLMGASGPIYSRRSIPSVRAFSAVQPLIILIATIDAHRRSGLVMQDFKAFI